MATVVEALAAAPKPQAEPGFFSREAGQARREWLAKELGYFIPPELRPVMGLANEINPVASMERAGTSAQTVFDPNAGGWDRVGAGANMLTEMAGVAAPMAMSGKGAVKAADAITESLTGLAVLPKAVGADFLADEFGGIKLYHGSPHDFDKFSMDKIGTGEGAQAYGHGLYFAEREGIAKSYRDALTGGLNNWSVDGVPVTKLHGSTNPDDSLKVNYGQAVREGRTPEEAIDWLTTQYRGKANSKFEQPENIAYFNEQIARLDAMRAVPPKVEHNEGRMYEVDINANPEDFLDWDAPLSGQPQKVRDALTTRLPPAGTNAFLDDNLLARPSKSGGYEYSADVGRFVQSIQGGDAAKLSGELREAGIPGIRYKDAGSRGADGTSGTSNYVVFDENLISIVKKYGIAGAATMLGMSQADVAEAMGGQQ